MRMSKGHKPEACVSRDETRPSLAQMHLDIDAKVIVATDGHMLVKIPVQIDAADHSGPVPVQALKAARTEAGRGRGEVAMSLNGACVLPSGAQFPRGEVGPFPDYNQVIPTARVPLRIGFNAAMLATLAQAMGTDGVVLTFDLAEVSANAAYIAPILVKPNESDNGALGVLMPMRV